MSTIAQRIDAMRRYGAGSNPMVFDDYRRPMRKAMLRDAKEALLEAHEAPWAVTANLSRTPISSWPQQARENVRQPLRTQA